MGIFLSHNALSGLKQYKYNSEDHSLVSKYVLKPFYIRLVNHLPLWLAPNMITLTGLLFSIASFLRAWYFNSNFNTTTTPRWVFFLHAFDMLAYQTLDALDGQQARRTGTSSPLGELFDHCVDALNTSLLTYVWASVSNLPKAWTLVFEFLCMLNFVVSTWEEYHTKRLYLSVFSGPVEGVLMVAFAEVIIGIVGQEIFDKVLIHNINVREILMFGSVFGLFYNTQKAISNVKKMSNISKITDLMPFTVMWIGFGIWAYISWDAVGEDAFLGFFLTIAFSCALLVGRIITAHVTNQPYPMWNPLVVIPYVGSVACLFKSNTVDDKEIVWSICGLAFGIYGSFVVEIITEITNYLGIACFYIKKSK